jgi:hypothetical protein
MEEPLLVLAPLVQTVTRKRHEPHWLLFKSRIESLLNRLVCGKCKMLNIEEFSGFVLVLNPQRDRNETLQEQMSRTGTNRRL